MNSLPKLTLAKHHSADAAYHYDSLMRVVCAVAQSPTSGSALERLQQLLHERYGVIALALEVMSGPVMRFQPYGDTVAITTTARQSSVKHDWQVEICRMDDPSAPPGQITYIYPHDSPVTTELLAAATAQIALRLGQETLTRRAEEAEAKARQRISEVATIYEIGQAIDRIELSRLLQLITNRTAHLMDAQACSLMLADNEAGVLRMAASHGLPEEASEHVQKIGEGIAGRVAQTEQPMLIVGGVQDSRLAGVTLRPEISSSMLVPMKDQEGSVLGVLSIRRRRPALDFTDDDLKLFSVFASQAALAVTNFRLYDNLERRASELLKISTLSRALISTLDLDQLLSRVADDICSIVGFDRCCLFIREGNRITFTPRVWRGYPDSIGRNPVKEGEGAVGMAARSKTLLAFDSREAVPAKKDNERLLAQLKGFARSLGTDAFVAAPILTSQNRCIGVVVADNRGRREQVTSEQISLLTAFVDQAGIAIENANLYDQMQENNKNILRLKNYTESVLQSSLAGIISTDTQATIARWNRAAEQTLGLETARFKEKTLPELIEHLGLPETERYTLLEMIRRVQETGEPFNQPKFTLHPQGREPITLNLMLSRLPDHNQERAGVVLIFDDMTQEARLEAKVKEMHRLADIGQLAAKMAHEVRNALSPIKGAAQIVRLDMETQNASTEWPDIIIAEVDGLSRLTIEMLDFARPTPLDPRPLMVEGFLSGAVQLLGDFLLEHQVTVHWDIPADLPELMADSIQLGQVVRNIVMNAAQAMEGGGDLYISAEYDAGAGALTIRFRDTGGGIAESEIARIFRPFVTTKTKGTGLGLPIVQKIVNHHGGQVTVQSRLGEGTCFSIELPLKPPREAGEAAYEETPLISSRPAGNFPDN